MLNLYTFSPRSKVKFVALWPEGHLRFLLGSEHPHKTCLLTLLILVLI